MLILLKADHYSDAGKTIAIKDVGLFTEAAVVTAKIRYTRAFHQGILHKELLGSNIKFIAEPVQQNHIIGLE